MPAYKKGEKTECSNDRGISLLSNTKFSSKIYSSRLTSNVDKITGDHEYGF